MQRTAADPNRFAQDLFQPLPRRYDLLEELLSFGQNGRWRREMVAHVDHDDPSAMLDVATGTAGVALALTRRTNAQITGIDITEAMLRRGHERVARAGAADRVRLVVGQAERLPFPDDSFDALTFTYLLRYVADPAATLRELARESSGRARRSQVWSSRCRRTGSGGPGGGCTRAACYRLRAMSRAVVSGVGSDASSDPTSRRTTTATPVAWTIRSVEGRRTRERRRSFDEPGRRARDVGPEAGPLSMARPAFYAARPGGWRDWWTMLHPPYTAWHLSYVVIGATLAPRTDGARLVATLLAFFFAVGVAAHALDELHGRPLAHHHSDRMARRRSAAGGLLIACALGFVGVATVGPGLLAFIVIGPLLVLGLQPRAVRRLDSHRPRVRGRMGRVPRARRLLRAGGAPRSDGGARSCRGLGYLTRAAVVEHAGARLASPGRARRRQRHDARRKRARAERASAAPAARTRAQLTLVGHGRACARIGRRACLLAHNKYRARSAAHNVFAD